MLLTEEVELKWHPSYKSYYMNLGYTYTKMGKTFLVKIEDLQDGSHVKVKVECDYCGIKTIVREFWQYNRDRQGSLIKKDTCKECRTFKIQESNSLKYGVDNVMSVQKYRERYQQSMLDNHGVRYPYQNKEILNKALIKAKKTMYKNGSAPSSRPQKHIQRLVYGELNYPINTLNLDIAFPQEKIYIEYDGGGHDLQVRFGNITKKEHRQSDRRRELLLQSKGWKLIRVVSSRDLLPSDEVIVELIDQCVMYLKSNRSWIEINIDEGKIKCSQYIEQYRLGELRTIREQDLNYAI